MNSEAKTFLALGTIAGLATFAFLTAILHTSSTQAPDPSAPVLTSKDTTRTYTSAQYGLSFSYPSTYYLKEQEVGTRKAPTHSIVMVEDTPFNRSVIDGTATEVMEGPTTINVDIYTATKGLDAKNWAKENTNWKLGDRVLTPTLVGGTSGYTFTWSGLYEGKSTVVVSGDHVYVFTVTWMDKQSPMLKDFTSLLKTVVFSNEPTKQSPSASKPYPAVGTLPAEQTEHDSMMCAQVITPAVNPATGERRDFPTPCAVPNGWVPISTRSEELMIY